MQPMLYTFIEPPSKKIWQYHWTAQVGWSITREKPIRQSFWNGGRNGKVKDQGRCGGHGGLEQTCICELHRHRQRLARMQGKPSTRRSPQPAGATAIRHYSMLLSARPPGLAGNEKMTRPFVAWNVLPMC